MTRKVRLAVVTKSMRGLMYMAGKAWLAEVRKMVAKMRVMAVT